MSFIFLCSKVRVLDIEEPGPSQGRPANCNDACSYSRSLCYLLVKPCFFFVYLGRENEFITVSLL